VTSEKDKPTMSSEEFRARCLALKVETKTLHDELYRRMKVPK